jgi:hypothetical protein
MTPKQFDKILENKLEKIKSILGSKANEYAQDNDRFFNFKQAARINNTTPEKAAWGMATKHLVSVQDLIEHRLVANRDMVDEKFLDMVNYLLIISIMLVEDK